MVSVPVLKVVLCIIVLAGVSSGNTSNEFTDILFTNNDINAENN